MMYMVNCGMSVECGQYVENVWKCVEVVLKICEVCRECVEVCGECVDSM